MEVNFFLIKNSTIHFKIAGGWTTNIELVPQPEYVFPLNEDDDNWRLCNELREILRNRNVYREGKLIEVLLLLDENTESRVRYKMGGPFINFLTKKLGTNITIEVSMAAFEYFYVAVGKDECWDRASKTVTSFAKPFYFKCSEDKGKSTSTFEGILDDVPFANKQNTHNCRITAEITIRVFGTVPDIWNEVDVRDVGPADSLAFNERILSEQFRTDCVIIAGNGAEVPCHKLFLTGNSAVFDGLLEGGSFVEGQTHSLALEEVSEAGVKALLKYLYYGDVTPALEDFAICRELLEASEKYEIGRLQQRIKKILREKQSDWYDVEGTLRLFCFSRRVDSCADIKILAANILKSKYEELQESENVKQLLKENAEATMDLLFTFSTL